MIATHIGPHVYQLWLNDQHAAAVRKVPGVAMLRKDAWGSYGLVTADKAPARRGTKYIFADIGEIIGEQVEVRG